MAMDLEVNEVAICSGSMSYTIHPLSGWMDAVLRPRCRAQESSALVPHEQHPPPIFSLPQ